MAGVDEKTTAVLALVISVAVAVWEIAKYRLEGGRVRVRMRAGLLNDYSLAQDTRSWTSLAEQASRRGGWNTEVAVVEVENPGRTAVTISEVSLDFGRIRWFRLGRHTVSPRHLNAVGATSDTTVRLESFDRAMFVFDVWQVLQPIQRDPDSIGRPTRIRASVRVAGRRGRRRSSWAKGWMVRLGQVSFIGDSVEIGIAAYQAMSRRVLDAGGTNAISVPVALAVRERFPMTGPAPTREQVQELIQQNNYIDVEPALAALIAFDVAQDLVHHYPHEPAINRAK